MPRANFGHDVRAAARKLWDAHNELTALRKEADAGDYGTALPAEIDGYAKADILAVPYATNDAIAALMNAGHATNVVKVLQ